MLIAVDFDGTCVMHRYPEVGDDCPHAVEVLKALVEKGNGLILYTMRSRKELQDAIDWFAEREIPLYGIQYDPTQAVWTSSNKCHAQLYIDDAAFGAPLLHPEGERSCIDWLKVKEALLE